MSIGSDEDGAVRFHAEGTIVAAVSLKVLEEMLGRTPTPPRAGEQKPSPERRAAQAIVGRKRKRTTRREVLRTPLQRTDIGKLELYCFANCATSMAPFVRLRPPTRVAPWIESYGNEWG